MGANVETARHDDAPGIRLYNRPFDIAPSQTTFIRWRNQKEAQMLVVQELEKMATRHGITRDSVMEKLAALPEAMTTDSGRIESVKMLARLVGVPVEKQPTAEGNTDDLKDEA